MSGERDKVAEPGDWLAVRRELYDAWAGLCFGIDWNNGTHAKAHRANSERLMRGPCNAIAIAASAPAVPEGFRLVPVEPTEAMLDAYVNMGGRFHSGRSDWAVMLAAAPPAVPAPPEPDQHLREALRKLVNEANAIAELARPSIGNTNVECLLTRCAEAHAALAIDAARDAERYRWLRELPNADSLNVRFMGTDLDMVIDAALAAEQKPTEGDAA